MQTLRAIKGFAISLAIGIAAYASTAVITTTANINSVQASSFEKQLERIHKRD